MSSDFKITLKMRKEAMQMNFNYYKSLYSPGIRKQTRQLYFYIVEELNKYQESLEEIEKLKEQGHTHYLVKETTDKILELLRDDDKVFLIQNAWGTNIGMRAASLGLTEIVKKAMENREVAEQLDCLGKDIGIICAENKLEDCVLDFLDKYPDLLTHGKDSAENNIGLICASHKLEKAVIKALEIGKENKEFLLHENIERRNIGEFCVNFGLEEAVLRAIDIPILSKCKMQDDNNLGMLATSKGMYRVASKVIDNKINLYDTNEYGKNIGMLAAEQGFEDLVLKCLDDSELSLMPDYKWDLLGHYCMEYKLEQAGLKAIENKEAAIYKNRYGINMCACAAGYELESVVLKALDIKEVMEDCFYDGETGFSTAFASAAYGLVECVKKVLKNENVKYQLDYEGGNVCMIGASFGHREVAELGFDDPILSTQQTEKEGENLGMMLIEGELYDLVEKAMENPVARLQQDDSGYNIAMRCALSLSEDEDLNKNTDKYKYLSKVIKKSLGDPEIASQKNKFGETLGLLCARLELEDMVLVALDDKENCLVQDDDNDSLMSQSIQNCMFKAISKGLENRELSTKLNDNDENIFVQIVNVIDESYVEDDSDKEKYSDMFAKAMIYQEMLLDETCGYENFFDFLDNTCQNHTKEFVQKAICKALDNPFIASVVNQDNENLGLVCTKNGMSEEITKKAIQDSKNCLVQDSDGENILMWAMRQGMFEAVELGLENPELRNQQSTNGHNVCMIFAEYLDENFDLEEQKEELESLFNKFLEYPDLLLQQDENGTTFLDYLDYYSDYVEDEFDYSDKLREFLIDKEYYKDNDYGKESFDEDDCSEETM